jgi:hypothetical protein
MNIKLTSAKGTNLGNFRTVEGITYFNPSKQLQSALADKFPTTVEEWQAIFQLLANSTVEELISDDIPASSFGDL